MARITHTDHAKVTAWTPQIKSEFSGPRLACAIELFRSVDFEKMPKALEHMQKIYEERKARLESQTAEAERPKCGVHGAIRPGAMCGHVIVGGEHCGFAGECEHKK